MYTGESAIICALFYSSVSTTPTMAVALVPSPRSSTFGTRNGRQSFGSPSYRLVLLVGNSMTWEQCGSVLINESLHLNLDPVMWGWTQQTEMTPPRGSNIMLTRNRRPSSPTRTVDPTWMRIRNALLYATFGECHLCLLKKWSRSITVDPMKLQPASGQKHGACGQPLSCSSFW